MTRLYEVKLLPIDQTNIIKYIVVSMETEDVIDYLGHAERQFPGYIVASAITGYKQDATKS